MHYKRLYFAVTAFVMMLLLAGCSEVDSNTRDVIRFQSSLVNSNLTHLKNQLNNGSLANVEILKAYTDTVKREQASNPSIVSLMDNLNASVRPEGSLYKNLVNRALAINSDPQTRQEADYALAELGSLTIASKPEVYNASLVDVINTVADLSPQLARLDAPKKEESLAANNATDFGPGSQLIGNPAYGQWVQADDGESFWEFYGQYRLFTDLIDAFDDTLEYSFYKNKRYRGRITQNIWNRHRDYSFYGDVSRVRYPSHAEKASMQRYAKQSPAHAKSLMPRKDYTAIKAQSLQAQSTYAKANTGKSTVPPGKPPVSTPAPKAAVDSKAQRRLLQSTYADPFKSNPYTQKAKASVVQAPSKLGATPKATVTSSSKRSGFGSVGKSFSSRGGGFGG